MVTRDELVSYLNEHLDVAAIPGDKSSNGLQVEGSDEVSVIVGAVDACVATYEAARELNADLIIVHHGEFWSSLSSLTGRTAERFRLLFQNDMSLYAVHLPLDAHPTLSHNAGIATMLDISETTPFAEYSGACVGLWGNLRKPMTLQELTEKLDFELNTQCQLLAPHDDRVSKVGIISGSGASAIGECKALGINCLITGEVGHTDFHPVQELGVAIIAAGHYCTEVPGVKAVLNLLANRFDVACEFVDIPTGL